MAKNSKPSRTVTRRRKPAKQLQEWRNSPDGRLQADGASKHDQIARRLQWLEQEWQLPKCPKVGRTMTKELREYVKEHGISWDWLLLGDLGCLQHMMRKRRMRTIAATPESFRDKLNRLSEAEREIIREVMDRLGADAL